MGFRVAGPSTRASRGLQGPQAPGPQGPGPQGPPPGLLQGPQELPGPKKLTRPDFGGFAGGFLPQGPHPQICSSQGPGPLQRASWKEAGKCGGDG